MASSSIVTLMDDLDNQNLLIQAAASAIPHQFDKCTYQLGYLRQAVSLCLDCKEQRGLCGGCSVSCHGDHQQIELFPKRNFRCDCPTRAMHHPCELNGAPKATGNDKLEVNEFNQYNQNYVDGGRFCRCHSHYDGLQEQETMVQCLACEDWFHESCLNLRERKEPGDQATPKKQANANGSNDTAPAVVIEREWDYATEEDEDDDGALIPSSDYDSFVCGECLIQSPMLLKWAGSTKARMVVRTGSSEEWFVWAGGPVLPNKEETEATDPFSMSEDTKGAVGEKRTFDQMEGVMIDSQPRNTEEPPTKRLRTETPVCSAPNPDPPIQALLDRIKAAKGPYLEGEGYQGSGDIFFTLGWREKWCRCKDCSFQLASRPYLEEEEETYELPEDPDAGKPIYMEMSRQPDSSGAWTIPRILFPALSLEDLGMKALSTLPRDQAINGIRAFQAMSAEFSAYLAPFAQEGRVVTEADVNAFFAARKQQEGKR